VVHEGKPHNYEYATFNGKDNLEILRWQLNVAKKTEFDSLLSVGILFLALVDKLEMLLTDRDGIMD
jgi:hypothetical protein